MAKKKKAEEHENLERWLVSYADFMTLLFATFVVLYALAQIDIKEFDKLEESIKAAFNNSPIAGGQAMMDGVGMQIINQGGIQETDAVIPPIMEYISQKYEKNSMEEIKRELEKALGEGEIEGIGAEITDRGLVITLKDIGAFFHSGSAQLTPAAQKTLNRIGALIKSKFNNHVIRVEGHTDSTPVNSGSIYPSNWELSGARSASVARFLIDNHKISPELFTMIGYADTRPKDTNKTAAGRQKNRRVEIVILKNSMAKNEPMGEELIKAKPKTEEEKQEEISPQKPLSRPTRTDVSDAAQKLLENNPDEEVIILDEFNNSKSEEIKEAIKKFESDKQTEKEKLNQKFY